MNDVAPAPEMTEYVVGFAFDSDGRVALIWKNRPAWQAGKLNGIGGHVEAGETHQHAMRREFREETGLDVDRWEQFLSMDFPGARIHFYRVQLTAGEIESLRTTTDEEIHIGDAAWLLHHGAGNLIPNLSWLLPLAMYTADDYDVINVRASVAEVLRPRPAKDTADA